MKELVVITGGSSGLGLELAKNISKEYTVCLVSRDREKLKKGIELLSTTNQHIFYVADVSIESEVKNLYKHIKDYKLKYIINCAGVGMFGEPENVNSKMVDAMIDSNLKSVIYMSSNGINLLKENGGTIVTILSTAALKGNPKESIYCATKWGARGYCEALKAAYKGTNIKIVTICPGGINTEFWKEDCGLSPNVEKFMNPSELAITIWDALKEKKTLLCTDMIIEKL